MVQPLARSTATPRAQPPPRATTPLPLPKPTFRTPPPHISTPGSRTTRGAPAQCTPPATTVPTTRRGVTTTIRRGVTTTRGGVNNARAATTTISRTTDFDKIDFLLAELNALQHKIAEDWAIQDDRHSAYLARVNTNKGLHTTECTQNVPPPSIPTTTGGEEAPAGHIVTQQNPVFFGSDYCTSILTTIQPLTRESSVRRKLLDQQHAAHLSCVRVMNASLSGHTSLTTRMATGSDGTPTPCTTPTGGGGIVGTTRTYLPAPASRGGRNDVPAVHTTSNSIAATAEKGSTEHLATHTWRVCNITTVRDAPTTTTTTREGSGIRTPTTTACAGSSFRAPPTIANRGESFQNILQPTASGIIPTTTTSEGNMRLAIRPTVRGAPITPTTASEGSDIHAPITTTHTPTASSDLIWLTTMPTTHRELISNLDSFVPHQPAAWMAVLSYIASNGEDRSYLSRAYDGFCWDFLSSVQVFVKTITVRQPWAHKRLFQHQLMLLQIMCTRHLLTHVLASALNDMYTHSNLTTTGYTQCYSELQSADIAISTRIRSLLDSLTDTVIQSMPGIAFRRGFEPNSRRMESTALPIESASTIRMWLERTQMQYRDADSLVQRLAQSLVHKTVAATTIQLWQRRTLLARHYLALQTQQRRAAITIQLWQRRTLIALHLAQQTRQRIAATTIQLWQRRTLLLHHLSGITQRRIHRQSLCRGASSHAMAIMSLRPRTRRSRRKPRHRQHASTSTMVQDASSSASTPLSMHVPAPSSTDVSTLADDGLMLLTVDCAIDSSICVVPMKDYGCSMPTIMDGAPGSACPPLVVNDVDIVGMDTVVDVDIVGVITAVDMDMLANPACSLDGDDYSTVPAPPTGNFIIGGPVDLADSSDMVISYPGFKAVPSDELVLIATHTEVEVAGAVVSSLIDDTFDCSTHPVNNCTDISVDNAVAGDLLIGRTCSRDDRGCSTLPADLYVKDNADGIPTWTTLSTMSAAIDDLCLELGLFLDQPPFTNTAVVMELCQAFSSVDTSATPPSNTIVLPSKPTTYVGAVIHRLLCGFSSIALSSGKVSVMDSWEGYWCRHIVDGLVSLLQAISASAAWLGSAIAVGLIRPPPEPPPSISVTYCSIDHLLLHATRIVEDCSINHLLLHATRIVEDRLYGYVLLIAGIYLTSVIDGSSMIHVNSRSPADRSLSHVTGGYYGGPDATTVLVFRPLVVVGTIRRSFAVLSLSLVAGWFYGGARTPTKLCFAGIAIDQTPSNTTLAVDADDPPEEFHGFWDFMDHLSTINNVFSIPWKSFFDLDSGSFLTKTTRTVEEIIADAKRIGGIFGFTIHTSNSANAKLVPVLPSTTTTKLDTVLTSTNITIAPPSPSSGDIRSTTFATAHDSNEDDETSYLGNNFVITISDMQCVLLYELDLEQVLTLSVDTLDVENHGERMDTINVSSSIICCKSADVGMVEEIPRVDWLSLEAWCSAAQLDPPINNVHGGVCLPADLSISLENGNFYGGASSYADSSYIPGQPFVLSWGLLEIGISLFVLHFWSAMVQLSSRVVADWFFFHWAHCMKDNWVHCIMVFFGSWSGSSVLSLPLGACFPIHPSPALLATPWIVGGC